MGSSILEHESSVRMFVFLAVLCIMAVWEAAAPRRSRVMPRFFRWLNNLSIVVLDTLVVRLILPVLAVGLASLAEKNGWGLLNLIDTPFWLNLLISLLFLDFAIYLQHRIFHAVPLLWRLHRLHHADMEFDVTTALRFHPLEILLSMCIKLVVVLALGATATAVLVFEVVLNATAMFNHSNVRLPGGLERVVRWLLVTPDMHRVHHSIVPRETNSNYGFNLPWWDRLLGTYRAQPEKGHLDMTIGIDQFRTTRELWLDKMLTQPFRGSTDRESDKTP